MRHEQKRETEITALAKQILALVGEKKEEKINLKQKYKQNLILNNGIIRKSTITK